MPESKFTGFQPPEPTIPNSIGHHREWIEACKTGGPTTCNFGYSGPLTEAALLAGMIQGPNRLTPLRHPERARQRRDWVLERMEELGWAARDEIAKARAHLAKEKRRSK